MQETDCGHIPTAISVLEDRVKALKGEEIDDPFQMGVHHECNLGHTN